MLLDFIRVMEFMIYVRRRNVTRKSPGGIPSGIVEQKCIMRN